MVYIDTFQMKSDVIKLAVMNRARHKRSYHGFGVLELKDFSQESDSTTQWSEIQVTILPSVSDKLVHCKF